MRILLLTILIFTPVYFYTREEEPVVTENIDAVKLKMGAPDRAERILTVEKTKVEETPELESEPSEGPSREITSEDEGSEDSGLEQVEEVQWTDLEEGWNNELKGMLGRLEPADGEEIYKTYMKEQEAYQAELDSLMNEKQQKSSDEAINEIDQLIGQLDSKHQEKLKDILGAHYEAVRDQYQQYMDSAEDE